MFSRLLVVIVLTAGVITDAQQPIPTFKAGIDLVQVDVSVFDKNRKPVRGLTAADFTIFEDATPQPIAAFYAVDVPDAPTAPVADSRPVTWMRDVAPDVQTNDPAAGRLMVLLIDDAMIPGDPKFVQNTRRIAQSVIDHLGPSDRLSVVFSRGGRPAQSFTADRSRLLKAVADIQAGSATYMLAWDTAPGPESYSSGGRSRDGQIPIIAPRPCGADRDIQARDGAVNTLQLVAETLIASPERRKALIYVSPGVPINVTAGGAIGSSIGNSAPPSPGFLGRDGCAQALASRESDVALTAILPELFRRMQRANVVIYPIDPGGPNGLRAFIERQLAGVPAMQFPFKAPLGADGSLTKDTVPTPGDLANFAARLDIDFLESAAANTGGRAIVNTEDFDTGIAQIFVESGSYYLLGYRAPADNKPGTLHRLKVTVNRPGVEARTRSGYFTPEPEKINAVNPSASPTKKALESLLPNADLPLQVALAPVAIPGKDEAAVTVVLGLQHASAAKPINDAVAVEVRAFSPDGARRGSQVQEAFLAVRPSATAEVVHYEALSSINLKPGRYQLRIAAYSGANDAAGSVFADVEVPDFAKEPVSLSGVLVTATPALPASPLDAFVKILPVVPTAARVFQKLDRVTAFVRLYQAVKGPAVAAALAVRVTNERGELVVNTTESFAADRFSGSARSVDYRFEVPMLTIARGSYLLTFEASLGAASARRDIRFSVR